MGTNDSLAGGVTLAVRFVDLGVCGIKNNIVVSAAASFRAKASKYARGKSCGLSIVTKTWCREFVLDGEPSQESRADKRMRWQLSCLFLQVVILCGTRL
jgi:hypothetical protein